MVLQIFFSQTEIREFFERNGFEVAEKTFGNWGKICHNRDEWNDYLADAVLFGDTYVEASELFKNVAEKQLKAIMMPTSEDVKSIVNTVKKQLKHHCND